MKRIFAVMLLLVLVLGCTKEKPAAPEGNNNEIATQPGDNTPAEPEETSVEEPTEPAISEPEEEIEEPEDTSSPEPEEETVTPSEEPAEEELPVQPAEDYPITLKADAQSDGTVKLTWTKYIGEMKNYRVVISNNDATPTYPTNDLLATIVNPDETTYTDKAPYGGVNYYSVTAIGPLNQKYASNPVEVMLPDPKESVPDQEITLKAEKVNNSIVITWTPYTAQPILYYKLVRSKENPKPKYPDDDTVSTIPYANETTYTDYAAAKGVLNYYAITVVRKDRSKFTTKAVSVMN